ncbi:MAG: EboA domain-containing protein [Pseudomonadota bacterium]
MTSNGLIKTWLDRQLESDQIEWLAAQADKIEKSNTSQAFDIAFGMIPRKLGKADLILSADDLAAANDVRNGWDPSDWTVDIAARVAMLVEASEKAPDEFLPRFKSIDQTADLGERLALFKGLPLYAAPENLVDCAALGLRTNIRAEFEAIAHKNPFPAENFDDNIWNNMVLKALFIGAILDPILGLDKRANAELATILRDYGHERWAAERPISPELWRCIGPFATADYMDDFKRLLETGHEVERRAGALALNAAPVSLERDALLPMVQDIQPTIDDGSLTWSAISDQMFDNSLAITRKLNTEVELTR